MKIQGNVNFPFIKLGKICCIIDKLDLETSHEITKRFYDMWMFESEKESFKNSIIDKILNNGCTVTDENISFVFENPKTAEKEGPVVYSPKIKIEVSYKYFSFMVLIGISIVACVYPNRSKIWSGIMLQENNLSNKKLELFFKHFEKINADISDYAVKKYESILKKVLEEKSSKSSFSVDHKYMIKTFSSTDTSFRQLVQPIMQRKIFSISKGFEEEKTGKAVRAFLSICFNKDINEISEYKEQITHLRNNWLNTANDRKKKWLDKPPENGYLWYGLITGNKAAIVSRIEYPEDDLTSFVGVGIDNRRVSYKSEDPKCTSRYINEAILMDFAPFI